MAMGKDDQMMKLLLIGGGAFAAYWYITNYGPSGAVKTTGGPSWWQSWFGGSAALPAGQTAAGSAAPSGGGAGAGASVPVQVSLQNTTNPSAGLQFKVGDAFQLTVHGTPNSPVTASVNFNGAQLPPAQIGTTDAQGAFTVPGTFTAAHVGSWVENWTVAGVTSGNMTFSVKAAGVAGVGVIPLPSFRMSPRSGARMARAGDQKGWVQ